MDYPALKSSIYELMHDLGEGLRDPDILMLGGGNPSNLKSLRDFLLPILERKIKEEAFFTKAFQNYSHPQGGEGFINALIDYLHRKVDWAITPEHVCVTQGSQQGFYMLYNYLIGRFQSPPPPPSPRPVLVLVKVPDYIGYFDLIPREHFLSVNGKITSTGEGVFTYSLDFPALESLLEKDGEDYTVRALVISSPNNPSSHILSQGDVDRLLALAEKYDQLIVFDHAYGFPFPNIVFGDRPTYPLNPHTLHCFSFSKLGLPGIRTGFMVGPPELIEKMVITNGIVNLSPSSLTTAFLEEILRSPELDVYVQDSLLSHYTRSQQTAFNFLWQELRDTPAQLHLPQGGFFLWLYAPGHPQSSAQLYEEIKSHKVVVVPGHYFFPQDPGEAYLRISYTMEEDRMLRGLKIIAETVKKKYRR